MPFREFLMENCVHMLREIPSIRFIMSGNLTKKRVYMSANLQSGVVLKWVHLRRVFHFSFNFVFAYNSHERFLEASGGGKNNLVNVVKKELKEGNFFRKK